MQSLIGSQVWRLLLLRYVQCSSQLELPHSSYAVESERERERSAVLMLVYV